jgi:putative DNA primase/helicase
MFLKNKMHASSEAPSPRILDLRGMRLAMASETGDGRQIDGAELKRLTGGDMMTGRAMRSNTIVKFRPTHTLIQQTNHRPGADATDQAVWDRMLLVPFSERFVKAGETEKKENEHSIDLTLEDDLKQEGPGILAWLLKGWQDYAARHAAENGAGLAPPDVVRQSTTEYRHEQNAEARFLAECCEDVPGSRVKAGDVKKAFDAWCRENNCRGSIQRLRKMIVVDAPDGTKIHEKATDKAGTFYLDMELTPEACELAESSPSGTQKTTLRGWK